MATSRKVKLVHEDGAQTREVEVRGSFLTQEQAERHVQDQYANAQGRGKTEASRWRVQPQAGQDQAGPTPPAEADPVAPALTAPAAAEPAPESPAAE